MKILALIPARGGSKRLPGKNIRFLGNKPLINWTIEVIRGIPEICNILVSTDDPVIAKVCTDAGACVPWLRPAELATDTASTNDVAIHALDWYEAENGAVDGVLLLQPTSPFRTRETVLKGIELFVKHDLKSVIGISPTHAHPMWALKMEGHYLVPFMPTHGLGMRSQDLPPVYTVNGSFYLITPAELRSNRSFFEGTAIPLLVESPIESIDIDTEWDFKVAASILE
ncbi:MAG: acylneuraminate cytidylyltransferase family protein [Rhodoferax sp.]|uniref:acylneuraminate cytidylyltransferase family protein n=1 Tax=Rhodoferax sp. TaxID=50421 RepID=UPI00261C7153|nr:acylneuraminate cytidylyltransferase family protein [Rhodoferax sp.]MDD5334870.1 acylneuraminate cytidylyltransferase family protein [Rhodoferax sp.]